MFRSLDTRKLGHGKDVAFGYILVDYGFEGVRFHHDGPRRHGDPFGRGFFPDVHHPGAAFFVEMCQFFHDLSVIALGIACQGGGSA